MLCLNNGTCQNQSPGYLCNCIPEYYGDACESSYNDCADDFTKCINGICIDQARNETDVPNFSCFCNNGWQLSSEQLCDRDVNECLNSPCYVGVACVNTPGSFYCGACPFGYAGNGLICEDINECLSNNGGCSTSPMVDCVNTPGSFYCGPCPPGFTGDGFSCEPTNPCVVENGGCHPMADCEPAPQMGNNAVTCTCPDGWEGNGYGPNGCAENASCSQTCDPVGGFCFLNTECICFVGWSGPNCDIPAGEAMCAENPCQNGGTCVSNGNSYYCECDVGFTGRNCETQADDCGGYYAVDAGNVRFPTGSGSYPPYSNCIWYIEVTRGNGVNISWSEFHVEQAANCMFDGIEIFDGPTTSDDRLALLCGNDIPDPTLTNNNFATIRFYSDGSVNHDGFQFHWETYEGRV
mgnify:CR=1 FL=1